MKETSRLDLEKGSGLPGPLLSIGFSPQEKVGRGLVDPPLSPSDQVLDRG